jgi:hypothetical protein
MTYQNKLARAARGPVAQREASSVSQVPSDGKNKTACTSDN